ncbi:hypothetical protein N7476_005174 [Penicillium atrosanguineum]|uniref:Major facilitator superfamily (MFS) profile domain-containing protein n=1 Tax=Penicillium atrosanguineum TaxID=1132637 RepID=A0A9W9U381_9EURO|nr:hypothetical protein N7476_005174 [Penicillium atrosanguineum]
MELDEFEPSRERDHSLESDEDIYQHFSTRRKMLISFVLSYCAFLAPISTTSILSATNQVNHTFGTTLAILNVSNAIYLIFMGLSPCFWGPLGDTFARRWICLYNAVLFAAFSIGTALAPNFATSFAFRILTAFSGTTFLVLGASAISDVYPPTERATALGWYLSGTSIGPAIGPVIGGITVTYTSWRAIYWVQTGLGSLGTIMLIFGLPETIHRKRSDKLKGLSPKQKARKLCTWGNPLRVIAIFLYPNLFLVGLASSALVWNMYSLLTPIGHILNPRFDLNTPLETGLLYLPPGFGYLVGVHIGGRYADRTVRKWTKIRGFRLPEDRLKSSFICLGLIIPGSMLVYGWSLDKEVGGMPLPIISMVVQEMAQLAAFPSLNAYFLDTMQDRASEATCQTTYQLPAHYAMRYIIAGISTSICLPIIDASSIGWLSTISSAIMVACAIGVVLTANYGAEWRKQRGEKCKATEKNNCDTEGTQFMQES